MIATGIVLAMNYTPSTGGAFNSVEHIMRDVNYGWLIRYIHTSGASMFFAVVYIHIFRGLYYGSYKAPRELLWSAPNRRGFRSASNETGPRSLLVSGRMPSIP